MKIGSLLKVAAPPVLLSSLCCTTPVVFVLLGASAGSFGVTLFTKTLAPYEWTFSLLGLASLGLSLVLYLRGRGICTLDQAQARRNEVINATLLTLIAGCVGYAVWYLALVSYAGHVLHLW